MKMAKPIGAKIIANILIKAAKTPIKGLIKTPIKNNKLVTNNIRVDKTPNIRTI